MIIKLPVFSWYELMIEENLVVCLLRKWLIFFLLCFCHSFWSAIVIVNLVVQSSPLTCLLRLFLLLRAYLLLEKLFQTSYADDHDGVIGKQVKSGNVSFQARWRMMLWLEDLFFVDVPHFQCLSLAFILSWGFLLFFLTHIILDISFRWKQPVLVYSVPLF